ncbi:hypothetical protein ES703_70943 [subsurface metagenome]
MSKLKSPFMSLQAAGEINKSLAARRRKGDTILEKKPIPFNPKSPDQIFWRHMFLKVVALWHALTGEEKQQWQSLARRHRMTGYNYFISQALRPNPGIYLPLQGGTMQGAIQMDGYHIHGLPLPIHVQDVWRRLDFQTYTLPYLYWQGSRVHHQYHQTIAHGVYTTLAFNLERYDTDNIHDNVVSNSRLTCQTAGKYIIVGNIGWEEVAVGYRRILLKLNGTTYIAANSMWPPDVSTPFQLVTTIWDLAITDYVELVVRQNSGGNLTVYAISPNTPEFQMQRIGS